MRSLLHPPMQVQTASDFLNGSQLLTNVINMFLLDRQSKRCSPHTIKFYRDYLQAFARFCALQAATEVQQVDAGLLRNYLLLLAQDHNAGGVHGAFRSLRAFFRWIEREELMPADWRNPIHRIDAPRVPQQIIEPIPLEDVDRLQAACTGSDFFNRRDRAVLFLLLDAGVRASELCQLDVADLNPVIGEVIVRHGKGGKDRIVYLGPTSLRAVQRYLRTRPEVRSQALFVSKRGERLTYDGVLLLIKRRCAKAGLTKEYSPHDFRRAFAVNMLRAGVDLYSLSRLMGHADIQVLRRYLALTAQDIQAAHRQGSPVESYRWSTA